MSERLQEPEWLLPLQYMTVGESFFIPTLKIPEAIYLIDTRAKEGKTKIKAYATTKEGYIGVRVWRVR